MERASDGGTTLSLNSSVASAVTASSKVKVTFTPIAVSATPAPVAAEPVVAAQSNEVQADAAPAAEAPVITTTEAPAAAKPAVKSGVGATIAAAAYAQLGVAQDCTALATNSLAAAGINYHGWPAGYLSLGRTVSQAEAQPGDLVYYADGGMGMAHIAVYVGNGTAVHGGWGGGTTALFSVNVGSGPVFIAIGH